MREIKNELRTWVEKEIMDSNLQIKMVENQNEWRKRRIYVGDY